jgi:hypothetical protein
LDHRNLGRLGAALEEEEQAVAALAVELVGCLLVEAVAVVEGHLDSFESKEPCGLSAG